MAQLSREQIETVLAAIGTNDYLCRVRDEIEQMLRVVFHANARADWDLTRRSAEQMLVAEIVSRYQGDYQRVFFALRAQEDGGQTWNAAIRELAAGIHSYFTTPLGMVMRQDLFGKEAVFITPDAYDWAAQLRGRPTDDTSERS